MILIKTKENWSWPAARWSKLTIEEAIYYKLSTEVTTLSGRVYPVIIEQGCALPAVAYKRISTRRDPTLTSQGGRFVSVQFDIIAPDYTSMRLTRDAVRSAFEDFVGQYGPGAGRDFGFDLIHVDLESVRIGIHKNRHRSRLQNSLNGSYEGIGRDNHFVPSPDIQLYQRGNQCLGAIYHRQAALAADQSGPPLLKFGNDLSS